MGQRLGEDGAVVLAGVGGDKVSFISAVGKQAQKEGGIHAGKLVGAIAKVCGGGGGGRPNFAQAGGRDPSRIEEALELARSKLEEALR